MRDLLLDVPASPGAGASKRTCANGDGTCELCGAPLGPDRRPVRRFCSGRCRAEASRRRRGGPDEFPRFVTAVANRLVKGERTYKGSALTRPLPELGAELDEEALDLAGWAFFVWLRTRALRLALERIGTERC